MRFRQACFVLLFVLALSGVTLSAQSAGTISGVVQDESGASIAGAMVTVVNADTGITRTVVSDAAGRYSVPGLIPGHYEVQSESSGFQTEVRKGLTLNVGSEIVIPVVLRVGQVTTKTEVTAEAPMIETARNELGTLVAGNVVRDLPLNGRSFDLLVGLDSAALNHGNGNPSTGFGAQFIINGALPNQNVYLVDGLELVGGAVGTTAPAGALSTNMGVDGVQEFKVLTGSYSSAYGKRSGAIVNIATRSGTNQIHGSGYEFLRNDIVASRGAFDVGSLPPYKRNQFGGTLGGPVRKDQTFIFGNYEGLRLRTSTSTHALYPDDNAKKGFVPCSVVAPTSITFNPNPVCNTATGLANIGVNPTVVPFLALFPDVNGQNLGNGTGYREGVNSQIGNQDYFVLRADHKISDKDSLMGRYNFSNASNETPGINFFEGLNRSRDQSAMLEEKRIISPQTLNSLRFGFTRGYTVIDTLPIPAGEPGYSAAASSPSLAFPGLGATFAGRYSFTGSAVVGATGAGGGPALGGVGSTQPRRPYAVNYFDLTDSVFHQAGAHGLSFGAQMQRIQHNVKYSFYDRGSVAFADLLSFLAGKPASFVGADTVHCAVADPPGCNNGTKGYRQIYTSAYLNDDWKLRPNLTINLGLRYEMMTVPVEVENKISNFVPAIVNGVLGAATNPVLGSPYFKPNHDVFAPRVGLAWDVFGNAKTAVRAGFGMFYDSIESVFMDRTGNNPPYYNAVTVTNPTWLCFFCGSTPVPTGEGVDPNQKVPVRLQYNLSIQQQVFRNGAITIGYVGAHGYHLVQMYDANQAIPQIVPGGTAGCTLSPCEFFAKGSPVRNPALGGVQIAMSQGDSSYHGLQADYEQRLTRGLRGKFSYTWSKNISDNADGFDVGSAGNANVVQMQGFNGTDKGLSVFDQRRNLVMNFSYDLPFHNFKGVTKKLVEGWQLSGIATLSAGIPVQPFLGLKGAPDQSRNNTQRPNLAPGATSNNPISGVTAGCAGVKAGQQLGTQSLYFDPCAFTLPAAGFYGNLGRNTVIGPGSETLNATMQKTTAITERINLTFRAEFFNLLNRVNFANPGVTTPFGTTVSGSIFATAGGFQPTAGQLTALQSPARQIQFGLKLTF